MTVASLPRQRGAEILRKIRDAFAREPVRISFEPSEATTSIGYFPEDLDRYVASLSDESASFAVRRPLGESDVLIMTMHAGSAELRQLWQYRRDGFQGIVAGWFWDNHVQLHKNLYGALGCDVLFPSHRYVGLALSNPVSLLAFHVPACATQFTPELAARLFDAARPRSDQLYCGYVAHPGVARNGLLAGLAAEMREADVLVMDAENRARFFGKSREDRFHEWLGYKASLVLPFTEDLSTRVFDGLLAGHVIVVPRNVRDFDAVVTPEDQEHLGVVRFDEWTVDAVRAAHAEALRRFERAGADGMRRRHLYVLGRHMLGNRLRQIRDGLSAVARGAVKIGFVMPERHPPGLRVLDAWQGMA